MSAGDVISDQICQFCGRKPLHPSFADLECIQSQKWVEGFPNLDCTPRSTGHLEWTSQSKKHLFICISSYGLGMSYTVLSIPVETLLAAGGLSSTSSEEEEEFNCVFHWSKGDLCYLVNCIDLEDGLYFVGDRKPIGDPKFAAYSWTEMSPQFLCVPFGQFPKEPSLYPPLPREEMTSGKSCPIAVVIGGILYVLAGPPYSDHVPDPCFEQYDPRTRQWSPLPAPSILKRRSKFFTGRLCSELAYAVIGTKLYLSSSKASVVYDCTTASKESTWEPCNLFDGFNPHGLSTPWKDNGHLPAYWKGPGDDTVIGPPFPFEKGANLYDNDTLICYAPCLEDAIVAFQIEDGRVVREQCLDNIPKHVCQKLADLGEGCFSSMYHEVEWNTMQTTLSVFCFKLSKLSKPVGADKFLDCEVCSTHEQDLKGTYFPFFAFVR